MVSDARVLLTKAPAPETINNNSLLSPFLQAEEDMQAAHLGIKYQFFPSNQQRHYIMHICRAHLIAQNE